MKHFKILWVMLLLIGTSPWGICQESIEPLHLMKVKAVETQEKIPYIAYVRDGIQKGYVEKDSIYPLKTDVALPQGSTMKVVFINMHGAETSIGDLELHGEAIFDIERLFKTQNPLDAVQELFAVDATDLGEPAYFLKKSIATENDLDSQPSVFLTPQAASLSMSQKVDYESGEWLLTSRMVGQVPNQQEHTQEGNLLWRSVSSGQTTDQQAHPQDIPIRTILNSFELPGDIK